MAAKVKEEAEKMVISSDDEYQDAISGDLIEQRPSTSIRSRGPRLNPSQPVELKVTGVKTRSMAKAENGPPSRPLPLSQPHKCKNNSKTDVPHLMQPEEFEFELIRTVEKTHCTFCAIDLNPGDGILINSCLHNFCIECIRSAIEQSDAAQIPCPFPDCQHYLLDCEIKKLISPGAYQNYLNRSMTAAESQLNDLFRCRGPQCHGIYAIPNDVLEFNCPQCESTNCVKCKSLKNVGSCHCPERNGSAKIDPEMKKEWDQTWAQMFQSVSIVINNTNSPTPSTSTRQSRGTSSVMNYLEKNKVIKSAMEFTCSICFSTVPPGDGIILKQCTHLFCQDCLAGVIEHCEDPQVKCPYQKDNWACPEFISEGEIKALVSAEIYEKVLKRSLNQAEMSMKNSFHCKTANCAAWCEFEEGATEFVCCNCSKKNCIKCQAIHESITCQEYQAKLKENEMDLQSKKAIADLISAGQAMKCPTCNIIIEKTIGCDWIVCCICKTQICWATKGPRWGPKGTGDKSGGCHCLENGIRCHPNCGNCH